ncbi:hypothetical protein P171DRAFT_492025 [Karstenula rhodostoma CBS 690.94]|uniref:Uncharacterized protein n=1 Tax=Karstenula rhodostoma CBS 690.94 TaxID=1392251 RepID=A0A9P4P5M5_9PLEO|nr:hypothetical protein P171DRAFT_492025 [Karstenula rhodostoma CBS 690.94]
MLVDITNRLHPAHIPHRDKPRSNCVPPPHRAAVEDEMPALRRFVAAFEKKKKKREADLAAYEGDSIFFREALRRCEAWGAETAESPLKKQQNKTREHELLPLTPLADILPPSSPLPTPPRMRTSAELGTAVRFLLQSHALAPGPASAPPPSTPRGQPSQYALPSFAFPFAEATSLFAFTMSFLLHVA